MTQSFEDTSQPLRWLDYKVKVTARPSGIFGDDERCYSFFVDSGLVWPVDYIDEDGRIWLALQYSEDHFETLRLEEGSYHRIPCDISYAIHK
ncbi:hypothetical protein [Yersinia aleksiciae]|uniref:Uncharacterized protein n=1 Tax=Yersinia aleksiciae TaxID=263819 RepID=A0A0T9T3X0_YERAE|nr:hypothetical protein [Yersinia aleksiciae]AKP34097.1 hypothetical protein ACZ76_11395 [Yersinia aleksiciae]MDA5498077.1 hypothetical protein [Yersinia aleksiciae]NIK99965.1 hypothetical protein [Yersinia aleksiciae]WQC70335.1 hypothetical protein N0K21_17160 [Yersinia aleksiciae]CFQ36208.1 Uncharacterised protein [Yersinia aleksiciae]